MTDNRFPDVKALRELFPVTEHSIYLNHAAIAPLSNPVRDAMETYLADRATWYNPDKYDRLADDLRNALARLINSNVEEIGFVQNTSEGINIIANALPLVRGDNVILCDMEFPSNIYPWMNLERRGVAVRCIPNDSGGLTTRALDRYADEQTRVVAVSSVQFLNGFRTQLLVLGRWCRENDIYLVVDGIQSLGALPMDVQACHIDFLSCGGPMTGADVVVSKRGRFIRVSPHCYNTEEEVLRVGEVLGDAHR